MSEGSRDLITWILGTVTSLVFLTGLVVRFVLLPYLRDHLVKPVQEVRRQVTENHHANDVPTLPDRIDDVQTDLTAVARVLDRHLESSEAFWDKITARLVNVEAQLTRPRPPRLLWWRRRRAGGRHT